MRQRQLRNEPAMCVYVCACVHVYLAELGTVPVSRSGTYHWHEYTLHPRDEKLASAVAHRSIPFFPPQQSSSRTIFHLVLRLGQLEIRYSRATVCLIRGPQGGSPRQERRTGQSMEDVLLEEVLRRSSGSKVWKGQV